MRKPPLTPKGIRTRERVAALLAEGVSYAETARRLGLAKPTVTYHARGLGYKPDPRFTRRYDWGEIRRYYDEGHSVRQCVARFGFSTETWYSAVKRGAVVPRPQAMPIEQLLAAPRCRSHLKLRLLGAGLLDAACAECGLVEWRGAPLALELHHVNGDGKDNRLENLQLLCPNCHSQTDSWGGRNRRRGGATLGGVAC